MIRGTISNSKWAIFKGQLKIHIEYKNKGIVIFKRFGTKFESAAELFILIPMEAAPTTYIEAAMYQTLRHDGY